MSAQSRPLAASHLLMLLLLVAAMLLLVALVFVGATPSVARAATQPSGALAHWSTLGGDKLDSFRDVAPKPGGGAYACGSIDGTWTEPSDLLIARITATGGIKWEHHWDSGDLLSDNGVAVAADGQGNAIVLGATIRSETTDDWVVLKYGPAGTLIWQQTYDGSGDSIDEARGLAVDDAGNVYVTGSTTRLWGNVYMRIAKYRGRDGKLLWKCAYGGPVPYAYGEDLVVDARHNVFVAGWQKTASAGLDAVVMKISPAGKRLWTKTWDGGGVNGDSADELALDGKGGLRVMVRSWSVAAGQDFVLLKYDTSGHRRWVRRWDGAAHKDELATALTVDGHGNAVVVGQTETVASQPGVTGAVVMWDAAGHRLWAHTFYNSALDLSAAFYDVTSNAAGDIWVGGTEAVVASGQSALVVKYGQGGKRKWAKLWSQPAPAASRYDQVQALVLSGPSTLWAAGLAVDETSSDDAMILKYVR